MHPARIAELLEPFLGLANNRRPAEDARLPQAFSERSGRANDRGLTTDDLQSISTYIDLLLRWNARINLTAIRRLEDIVTRHFGESLFAARHLFPLGGREEHDLSRAGKSSTRDGTLEAVPQRVGGRESGTNRTPVAQQRYSSTPGGSAGKAPGERAESPLGDDTGCDTVSVAPAADDRVSVADLGSGAGFPGIPIKLWAPEIALTLIESNHKKGAFLREVVRALKLTDVNVFAGRAEDLLGETPVPESSVSAPLPSSPRLPSRRPASERSRCSPGLASRPRAAAQPGPVAAQIAWDVVTLRAVERFDAALAIAARLVSPGGRLALLIGESQIVLARSQQQEISWEDDPIAIPLSESRVLLIGHRL